MKIIIEYSLTLLIIIILRYKKIRITNINEQWSLLLLSINEFYKWLMIIYVNKYKLLTIFKWYKKLLMFTRSKYDYLKIININVD